MKSEFNASRQKLPPEQENVLVAYIQECGRRGFALDHAEIRKAATALYAAHAGKEKAEQDPLGINWVDNFVTRHHDKIAGALRQLRLLITAHQSSGLWANPLDMQRAKALNPHNIEDWFENVVKPHIVDQNVPPECIFGTDETGVSLDQGQSNRVVAEKGTKRQHQSGGGNRGENVTAIITICGDGTALKPTYIFRGEALQKGWTQNNVAEAS